MTVLAVCAASRLTPLDLERRAVLLRILNGTTAELADETGAINAIHADHRRSLTESHAGVDPHLKFC